MANTIMSAKNSFQEGLIMDFSPDNTQATCMTSALNATLLTFNGNEMQLQNDMGNGRVETAYLPEGYVPVGTCEFGDIIYIVSYNPLINKSQIGCFPSPERNITSEEVGDMNVSIRYNEFQDISNEKITGKLKTTAIKKIIYNRSMNSGDKYIVYADSGITSNASKLSDYGNYNRLHGGFPKLTKIHIIAIEDSGKITFLDSSVKWYDNDYYIQNVKQNSEMLPDIDSYRSLVSSAYSVFQSKVSGKLALLIELERIQSLDCSYSIYTGEEKPEADYISKSYKVYYNVSWDTDNPNINPSELVITKSEWPNSEGNYIRYKESKNDTNPDNKYAIPEDLNWNPGKHHYGVVLSRTYKPESGISYEDFLKDYDYSKVIDNLINDTWGYDKKDPNSYPTTLVQAIKDGHPEEDDDNCGVYYINANHKDGDNYCYYTSNGESKIINAVSITDDLVNNYFNKSVSKYFGEFNIPYKNKSGIYLDTSNFVWNYSIAPAMPYGVLEDLTINGTIDFSKVGSGYINLSEWRYYNDSEISTLKWGLETYPEEGKKISQVRLEFYDNQGLAASYLVPDKASYSGSFTESIQLGPSGTNPNLLVKDIDGKIIRHLGQGPFTFEGNNTEADQFIELVKNNVYIPTIIENGNVTIYENNDVNENNIKDYNYYVNDAGCIYPNLLYLVNIYVDYQAHDNLGEPVGEVDRRVYCRSYWTNTLMNRYYYQSHDFDNIVPQLDFNLDSTFISTSSFSAPNPEGDPKKYIKNNSENAEGLTDPTEDQIVKATMGCVIQEVGSTGGANVKLYINPKLEDSYGSFAFDQSKLSNVTYTIGYGTEQISTTDCEIQYSEHYSDNIDIKPVINTSGSTIPSQYSNDYKSWKDWFTLEPINIQEEEKVNPNIVYYDIYGNEFKTGENYYSTTNAVNASTEGEGISLLLQGNMFNKIAGTVIKETNIDAIVYKPIIHVDDDFNKYGITTDGSSFYFSKILTIGPSGDTKVKPLISSGSASGTFGGLNLPSVNQDQDVISSIQNIKIGQTCLDKNIDVGMFSLLTFWCYDFDENYEHIDGSEDDHRDGWIEIRTGQNSRYNATSWKNKWNCTLAGSAYKYYGGANNSKQSIREPYKEENRSSGGNITWKTPCNSNNTLGGLVVKNNQGDYILYNNFCQFLPGSAGSAVTQRFSYNKDNWTDSAKNATELQGTYTMAQMIASLLTKIYVRSEDTEAVPVKIVGNVINCSDYIETWEKDIVVKSSCSTNTNELLSIVGINYQVYLSSLYNKYNKEVNVSESDSRTAININFDKVHTIQFQYSLPYNIKYLKDAYNIASINKEQYRVLPDWEYSKFQYGYQGGLSAEPPYEGDLGFVNKEGQLLNTGVYEFPSVKANGPSGGGIIRFSPEVINRLQNNGGIIEFPSTVTQKSTNTYRIYMIGGNTDDTKNSCYITFSSADVFINEDDLKLVK